MPVPSHLRSDAFGGNSGGLVLRNYDSNVHDLAVIGVGCCVMLAAFLIIGLCVVSYSQMLVKPLILNLDGDSFF